MMLYSYNNFVSQSLHQMEPRQPTLKAQPPIPLEQKTLMHSTVPQIIHNQLSPPFYTSPNQLISVTCADLMTIEQTANWIWTYGFYKGWAEAETYATSFRKNSITGRLLPQLTNENLESSLGIIKSDHRTEVLSTIRFLFPNIAVNSNHCSPKRRSSVCGIDMLQSPCNSESSQQLPNELGECKSFNLNSIRSYESDADCESVTSYLVSGSPTLSYETSQMDCSDIISESGNSKFCSVFGSVGSDSDQEHDPLKMPQMTGGRKSILGHFENGITKEDVVMMDKPVAPRHGNARRQLRCNKLQITLTNEEFSRDVFQMDRIRARFEKMNFDVKIKLAEKKPQTYVLTFKDCTEATNALLQADKIGYTLSKKWPVRPSPKRPILYQSLAELIIREGKAFSGNEVGVLPKGETVTVNQVKGRRARLVKQNQDGELVTWGWVSVHNSNGLTLLTQLNDD